MSKKVADISVIVPIYNVEEYLAECLDSIVCQTKQDFEVIMVDDGSTDSSGEIAKAYAEKHPNFHYLYKENNGLGCARNYGVAHSDSKYIIFMDSDDKISEDLYEKMFNAAEKNQSDLTICNVVRCNSRKAWASSLHKIAFADIDANTHITKNTNLFYDTTSWNKLILRSFYEENHFAFPENILYEDIPVTIPMHFKANNVSVVESAYYYWRVRDGATKSITQTTDDFTNLYDRLSVLKMVNKFIEENNIEEKYRIQWQIKLLQIDLIIYINNCTTLPEETFKKTLDIVNEYIDEYIDEAVFSMLPLINQQKYAYARAYEIEKLIKLIEYQKKDYYNAKIEEKDGRFIATLPDEFFTIESRDATNELAIYEPKKNITDITLEKDKLEITAYLYKSSVNIEDFSQQNITVYLENEVTNHLTPLDITPVENKGLTEQKGTLFDTSTNTDSNYNYDGTGFKFSIDLNKFDINENNKGYNRVLVCYENRVRSGKVRLGCWSKVSPNSAIVLGNKHIRVMYDDVKELRLYINNEKNFASKVNIADNKISVTLENEAKSIYAVNAEDETIEFSTKDGKMFTANCDYIKRGITYSLFIKDSEDNESVLLYRSKRVIIKNNSYPSAIFMTNKNHQLRFTVNNSVTSLRNMYKLQNFIFMDTVAPCSKNELSKAKKAVLYVNDNVAGERVVFAKSRCIIKNGRLHCAFLINFNNNKITKNLYASTRDLYIAYENKDGEIESHIIYSSKYYKRIVKFETLELNCYRGVNCSIRMKISQLWKESENTANKRKALTAKNYPKYRTKKIDEKCIVFESMWGSKYSCNPQHLYEYIDKNYPEYKCVWSLKDARMPIKGKGIRVRKGSQEYFKYLATAKHLVNNVNFEEAYVKRNRQIVIQTMHGTPLKTLGYDVPGELTTKQEQVNFAKKIDRWDYLVVQGKFMEEKSVPIYKFEKEILRTGYPRTDIFFKTSESYIEDIKKNLGIPLDKKVILYTPTWRIRNKFDMQLDLDKMRERLGDEYVVLIRLHYFCGQSDYFTADNKFVFNLRSYRTVEDLYLISDMLITDYSSVMFDYALLDKPMLFFTFDLEDYRDNLRGMYVDIEEEAPGPLVFNTDEVINAILNIDEEMKKYSEKISAFRNRYLTYENGNSCQTIIDTVIQPTK
ncbi:MAG: CDP-glycerol glycerophosphotransferase family protein [Eubacterium sp.]|nr:CDP-glycerol glycerophosphotransferase family protein [Eubacterium sp.]